MGRPGRQWSHYAWRCLKRDRACQSPPCGVADKAVINDRAGGMISEPLSRHIGSVCRHTFVPGPPRSAPARPAPPRGQCGAGAGHGGGSAPLPRGCSARPRLCPGAGLRAAGAAGPGGEGGSAGGRGGAGRAGAGAGAVAAASGAGGGPGGRGGEGAAAAVHGAAGERAAGAAEAAAGGAEPHGAAHHGDAGGDVPSPGRPGPRRLLLR